eukprot:6563210-Prymnesium_polylepis.1
MQSTGLTFIHSYAATNVMQAMLFNIARNESLVRESDLLIECNNRQIPASLLKRYLELYPHSHKRLLLSSKNEGYRCAQMWALARHFGGPSAEQFWSYSWVLMLNPDVFPSAAGM